MGDDLSTYNPTYVLRLDPSTLLYCLSFAMRYYDVDARIYPASLSRIF